MEESNNENLPPHLETNNASLEQTTAYRQFSKVQIIKNLTVICIGFVSLFIAYNGLSMLQSTMNQEQGIGVASQAIIYAAFCISALLLPKYTIRKLGCKRTLVLSMFCYVPYVAANFYFNWFTVIPSAVIVGLGASLLWSSQCTYFNESSVIYSTLTFKEIHDKREGLKTCAVNDACDLESDEKVDTFDACMKQDGTVTLESLSAKTILKNVEGVINSGYDFMSESDKATSDKDSWEFNLTSKDLSNLRGDLKGNTNSKKLRNSNLEEYSKLVSSTTARFFGLFGLIFRTSDIWSNLMSYYVLIDNSIVDNITDNGNCSCGAAFCNVESQCFEHNLAEPNQRMRNILSGVSVLLALFGVFLVFLFLDELEMNKQPVKFSFNLAMATCKFVRKRDALLLLPLSVYIGAQQTFYMADFTKSYIACAWGVYHVGLVTMCYGAAAAISSTLAGFLVKYIGRISVMLLGTTINVGVCVFLLVWNPLPDQPTQFFISAAFYGTAVGILWSQLRAYYGVIFKKDEEAAFAGFYLWDSIGYCAAFSYSNYLCTNVKIYILLAILTAGITGYLKTEQNHKQTNLESEPD